MKTGELYTIAEVCDLLKVHERTVYRWLKAGKLKAFKAGKLWRIPAKSLDVFLYGEAPFAPEQNITPSSQPSLDTQSSHAVGSASGINPATEARESARSEHEHAAAGPTDASISADADVAGDAGIVEERRTVRIRYETLEGVIRYDEKDPTDFEVHLDHPVRDKVIEHFTSERDFKTPASRHDDRHIERARPVDDPSYFSLALCTLHVSTGVRVDW